MFDQSLVLLLLVVMLSLEFWFVFCVFVPQFVGWMVVFVCCWFFRRRHLIVYCLFAYGLYLILGGKRLVTVLMWFHFKTQKGLSIQKPERVVFKTCCVGVLTTLTLNIFRFVEICRFQVVLSAYTLVLNARKSLFACCFV